MLPLKTHLQDQVDYYTNLNWYNNGCIFYGT